jgi:hypothetical protein
MIMRKDNSRDRSLAVVAGTLSKNVLNKQQSTVGRSVVPFVSLGACFVLRGLNLSYPSVKCGSADAKNKQRDYNSCTTKG